MDEEEFKEFLLTKKRARGTIKGYVSHVKKFEEYLLKYKGHKELERANPVDIKRFVLWVARGLRDPGAPLFGIQEYYEYKRREKMVEAIKKLKSELPKSKAPAPMLITWDDFQERMEEVEKIGISDRNRALLNLHWSRMNSDEILQLRVSDVDFEKYYIKSGISGSKFYVTEKAWNALEKYIPIEERDKRDRLFQISKRNLQHLVQKYFEELGQNPTTLRKSCESELIEAGLTRMFTVLEEKPKTEVGVSKKKIEELVFPTEVLEKLPPQVRKTVEGVIMNYRKGFPNFSAWGMRKGLIDAIRIRFKRDKKEHKLYDKDGNAYALSKWIELTKQERYIDSHSAKYLKGQVKVFGDIVSHDYMVDLRGEEVPLIFTRLRIALAKIYYEGN